MLNVLKPFARLDLEPLLTCWYDTWHATFVPRRHPQPRGEWRRRFVQDYASRAEVWVLPDQARIVACMVLFPGDAPGQPGWLEQLFVSPDHQNCGIGRDMIALARFRCPEGLELDTPAENLPARDFYRRRGFRPRQIGYDPLNERVTVRYAWPGRDVRLEP